jgi:hypothetical protein
MLSNTVVKMYKSFYNETPLVTAVGATIDGTIDKCMVTSDVVGTETQFPRMFRDLTKEDKNGEAGSQFVLLEFNTSCPVPEAMIRRRRRLFMDNPMSKTKMGIQMFLGMISDMSRQNMLLGSCRIMDRRRRWCCFGRICKTTNCR